MIRVLAIDDEPLALMQLQKMIEKTPYFSLTAACHDAFEAMHILETEEVDCIFTDINMPDLSGLDFVRSLNKAPIVVFTTAYSQYALDGYKVNALDYLLKPFGMPEFQRVATKVKQHFELLQSASAETEGDILFVKVDYRLVRLSISDIRYVESQSEYLRFFMEGGATYMVLMNFKRLSELLPADRFIRIHRSYVVNMSKVMEIAKLRIKMDAQTYLPVGDLYKETVMDYINQRTMGK